MAMFREDEFVIAVNPTNPAHPSNFPAVINYPLQLEYGGLTNPARYSECGIGRAWSAARKLTAAALLAAPATRWQRRQGWPCCGRLCSSAILRYSR